jgi:hypothetical protein
VRVGQFDPLLVASDLHSRGITRSGHIATPVFLQACLEATYFPGHGDAYAAMVLDNALRRRTVQAGVRITQLATSGVCERELSLRRTNGRDGRRRECIPKARGSNLHYQVSGPVVQAKERRYRLLPREAVSSLGWRASEALHDYLSGQSVPLWHITCFVRVATLIWSESSEIIIASRLRRRRAPTAIPEGPSGQDRQLSTPYRREKYHKFIRFPKGLRGGVSSGA